MYGEDALALSMSGDKMVTLSWGMQANGFLVNKTLLENGNIDHALDKTIEDVYNASILYFFEGNTPFSVPT